MRFCSCILLLICWTVPSSSFSLVSSTTSSAHPFARPEAVSTQLQSSKALAESLQQQEQEGVANADVTFTKFKNKKSISESVYAQRLEAQLQKMRTKDATSPLLSKQELKIVYEDEHIVAVNKPSAVLSVSGWNKSHSLAEAVFLNIPSEFPDADRMVVHRLGFETSGLMVLAKTLPAVRGMNELFRTRSIERRYEALVCGNIQKNRGVIDLPLMRDYEFPPFQRISTDEHQEVLVQLDAEIVGKKLLELPKESLTRYEVISREELNGQPVTRVLLTSISGRTHQLNCHLAAFGHPIVGDTTYGIDGAAAPNGGLNDDELQYLAPNKNRASPELQRAANANVSHPCIHATSLRFRHPVTKETIALSSDAPF